VAAWWGAAAVAWRRRAYGGLAVLGAPLFALLAQIDLTVRYPVDWIGMIKGAYVQFAMPPLAATFGVGVAWLWYRRWAGRAAAACALAGLVLVAAYVAYCRAVTPNALTQNVIKF
jgi:hypothetical protein